MPTIIHRNVSNESYRGAVDDTFIDGIGFTGALCLHCKSEAKVSQTDGCDETNEPTHLLLCTVLPHDERDDTSADSTYSGVCYPVCRPSPPATFNSIQRQHRGRMGVVCAGRTGRGPNFFRVCESCSSSLYTFVSSVINDSEHECTYHSRMSDVL